MVDWKKNMLIFMKLIGDKSSEWHADHWVEYGITKEDALRIIDEYEKEYPEDA